MALLLAVSLLVTLWPSSGHAQTLCTTFVNRTTGDGLGSNFVLGVYAVGSTVYAATLGGLSLCALPVVPTGPVAVGGTGLLATSPLSKLLLVWPWVAAATAPLALTIGAGFFIWQRRVV